MIDHMGFASAISPPPGSSTMRAQRPWACRQSTTVRNPSSIARSLEAHIPFIWVGTALPAFWDSGHATSMSPIHLAFKASDRSAVERFYQAAIAAGGRDNGAPGPRGPVEMKYYAAFVLDPDGNNVEAGVRE